MSRHAGIPQIPSQNSKWCPRQEVCNPRHVGLTHPVRHAPVLRAEILTSLCRHSGRTSDRPRPAAPQERSDTIAARSRPQPVYPQKQPYPVGGPLPFPPPTPYPETITVLNPVAQWAQANLMRPVFRPRPPHPFPSSSSASHSSASDQGLGCAPFASRPLCPG
jgi:hypothetical protein